MTKQIKLKDFTGWKLILLKGMQKLGVKKFTTQELWRVVKTPLKRKFKQNKQLRTHFHRNLSNLEETGYLERVGLGVYKFSKKIRD